MRRMRRQKPVKEDGEVYAKVWRLVDGAVKDAIYQHPGYFPGGLRSNLRCSITKRVTGAIKGWVDKTRGADKPSAADNGG